MLGECVCKMRRERGGSPPGALLLGDTVARPVGVRE